jgi:hypothetical protein
VLLGAGFVLGDILSINYPAPNDIISTGSRIRLNVTSDGFSTNCYFNYDNVSNQSVACDGVSLVNMPNADETYRIKVGDGAGNYISQQVTIQKPDGIMVMFVTLLTVVVLCVMIFMTVSQVVKLATFNMKMLDLVICLCLYLVFLFVYQLNVEYMSVPFIMDYLDLFLNWALYIFAVFAPMNYLICIIVRMFKKKKNLSPEEY